jgi:hypothetical protein
MTRIYLNIADRGACSYYRARLPARHCTDELEAEGIELVCSEELDGSDNYDAYIFHRLIHPHFMPYMEQLKKQGKKIVIELDDDVWHIPQWNPAAKVFGQIEIDSLNWTLDLADEIWVSTSLLGSVVDRGDKVRVLPNLIDPSDYPQPEKHEDGRVRILWAGSIHHDEDLRVIAPAVETVIEQYGSKVQFLFFGHWPEALSQWMRIKYTNLATSVPRRDLAPSLAYVDPVDLTEYPNTLCGLGADIGICPLVDCQFNLSKSGIKAMEYTLAGAVPLATDLPPYAALAPGILTVRSHNWIAEWVHTLDWLICNEAARAESLARSRVTVISEHSWNSPAKTLWLDAFRSLAEGAS